MPDIVEYLSENMQFYESYSPPQFAGMVFLLIS